MLCNIMPENLYLQLPTEPSMSQESFNTEMVRKYYQDIANLKDKYNEILRTNIMKSNGSIDMLTIDYYMHLQVQAP